MRDVLKRRIVRYLEVKEIIPPLASAATSETA